MGNLTDPSCTHPVGTNIKHLFQWRRCKLYWAFEVTFGSVNLLLSYNLAKRCPQCKRALSKQCSWLALASEFLCQKRLWRLLFAGAASEPRSGPTVCLAPSHPGRPCYKKPSYESSAVQWTLKALRKAIISAVVHYMCRDTIERSLSHTHTHIKVCVYKNAHTQSTPFSPKTPHCARLLKSEKFKLDIDPKAAQPFPSGTLGRRQLPA